MPARVTAVSATPESWSRTLPSRDILYDSLHGEMIGEELTFTTGPGDNAFQEYDIIGDDGDDEAAYEDSHEDGEEEADDGGDDDGGDDDGAPEGDEPPGDVVQMAPDSGAPGPSGEPAFAPVTGPAARVIRHHNQPHAHPRGRKRSGEAGVAAHRHVTPKKVAQVKKAISHFRAQIKARNPVAVKALFNLQAQAKTSPVHANVLRAVVSANLNAKSAFHFAMGDEAIAMSGTAHGAIAKILTLALSPVAWATHGVGSITKTVGNQLEGLARKL